MKHEEGCHIQGLCQWAQYSATVIVKGTDKTTLAALGAFLITSVEGNWSPIQKHI